MSQPDELARLAEAVSGLEQAISGIAAILEGHGELLARLLEAAEEKPPDETETQQLLKSLISKLDQQQGTLQRIEKGMETVGEALMKALSGTVKVGAR
jgi:small-conductance mechanosensitive channel